jgi:hypothetical protein
LDGLATLAVSPQPCVVYVPVHPWILLAWTLWHLPPSELNKFSMARIRRDMADRNTMNIDRQPVLCTVYIWCEWWVMALLDSGESFEFAAIAKM